MIRYLVILTLLFCSNSCLGQSDYLVVINSKGTASYSPEDGGKPQALVAGITMPVSGTIFLNDDATLKLIVNQKFVLLNGKGRYDVKEIFDSNSKKSMSFSARFWKFVTAGMSNKNDKGELAKYHQQYMNVHGGIKGYSSNKGNLTLLTPINGNVASNQIFIEWESKTPTEVIMNLLNDERGLIHKYESKNKVIEIDLSSLDIVQGKQYFIELKSLNNAQDKIETSFVYIPDQKSKVLERLDYLPAFETSTNNEKQWMTANVLEMEKFNYDTYNIYCEMIKADPDNMLLKKTFANYLIRQDKLTQAEELLSK